VRRSNAPLEFPSQPDCDRIVQGTVVGNGGAVASADPLTPENWGRGRVEPDRVGTRTIHIDAIGQQLRQIGIAEPSVGGSGKVMAMNTPPAAGHHAANLAVRS